MIKTCELIFTIAGIGNSDACVPINQQLLFTHCMTFWHPINTSCVVIDDAESIGTHPKSVGGIVIDLVFWG